MSILPPASLDDIDINEITYNESSRLPETSVVQPLDDDFEIIVTPIIKPDYTIQENYDIEEEEEEEEGGRGVTEENISYAATKTSSFEEITEKNEVPPSEQISKVKRFNKIQIFIQKYKFELYCTINYMIIYFTFGLSLGSLGPALKVLQQQTNTTEQEIGFLFVTRGMGFIVGAMLSGRLIDYLYTLIAKKSSSPLIKIVLFLLYPHRFPEYAIVLTSIAYLLITRATNFLLLNGIVFLTGISGGFLDVVNNTFIMWTWKEKSLTFLQFIHLGFGIGALSSGFVFGSLQYYFDERTSVEYGFILIAILTLPMGLGVFFVHAPSPYTPKKPVVVTVQEEKEITDFQQDLPDPNMHNDNNNNNNNNKESKSSVPEITVEVDNSGGATSAMSSDSGKIFSEYHSRMLVIGLCGLYLLIYVGAESGYAGLIYSYAIDTNFSTSQEADYLTATFWVFFTLFRFIFIFISTKITASFMLFLCTFFCLCVSLFLGGIELLYYFSLIPILGAKIGMWVATIMMGAGTSACYPSCMGLPQELGIRISATSTSMMVLCASIGELVFPAIAALLMGAVGPYTFPIVFIVIFVVGVFDLCGILFSANVPLRRWVTVFHSSGSLTSAVPSSSEEIEMELSFEGEGDQSATLSKGDETTFRRIFHSMREKLMEADDFSDVSLDNFDETERRFQIPI